MADDDDYWNSSNAKGFSWDDASDSVSLPSTFSNSIVSNTAGAGADIVSFDSGVSSNTNSRLSERARDAAKLISSAADLPEPSISQIVGVRDINSLETELKLVRRNFAKLNQIQNEVIGKFCSVPIGNSTCHEAFNVAIVLVAIIVRGA